MEIFAHTTGLRQIIMPISYRIQRGCLSRTTGVPLGLRLQEKVKGVRCQFIRFRTSREKFEKIEGKASDHILNINSLSKT